MKFLHYTMMEDLFSNCVQVKPALMSGLFHAPFCWSCPIDQIVVIFILRKGINLSFIKGGYVCEFLSVYVRFSREIGSMSNYLRIK